MINPNIMTTDKYLPYETIDVDLRCSRYCLLIDVHQVCTHCCVVYTGKYTFRCCAKDNIKDINMVLIVGRVFS